MPIVTFGKKKVTEKKKTASSNNEKPNPKSKTFNRLQAMLKKKKG